MPTSNVPQMAEFKGWSYKFGDWVYGRYVTDEYLVTIADGEFRDIINETGSHVVDADRVYFRKEGETKWTKLPSRYAEERKRAYEQMQ